MNLADEMETIDFGQLLATMDERELNTPEPVDDFNFDLKMIPNNEKELFEEFDVVANSYVAGEERRNTIIDDMDPNTCEVNNLYEVCLPKDTVQPAWIIEPTEKKPQNLPKLHIPTPVVVEVEKVPDFLDVPSDGFSLLNYIENQGFSGLTPYEEKSQPLFVTQDTTVESVVTVKDEPVEPTTSQTHVPRKRTVATRTTDKMAEQRRKNNIASKECRKKRKLKDSELEQSLQELEIRNKALKKKAAILERQVNVLKEYLMKKE